MPRPRRRAGGAVFRGAAGRHWHGVALHEVYPASEGFIAAQDAEPEAGLRLLADRACSLSFYLWQITGRRIRVDQDPLRFHLRG